LGELVKNLAMGIISNMVDLVSVDGAQPKIVCARLSFKNVHSYVRFAKLVANSSKGTIPQIYSSVLFGSVSHHGLGSFEGVDMIFEGGHHFVLVEIGDPVEKGIKVASRIFVKFLAG